MTLAVVVATILWPAAGLVALWLVLRARDVEADKRRRHELALEEARQVKLSQSVADELKRRADEAEVRLGRLETRAALTR
jgi:hypothetical protein